MEPFVVLLRVILIFVIAFSTMDYTLNKVWRNSPGCAIASAIFAILCAIFLGGLLA